MPKASRILTAISALLLGGLYAFPLWRISLLAPQYPEGIGMLIRINTVEGIKEFDLKNLNELNHYIGMKIIDPDTIPELKYFPWIVAGLIATGLLVALWGKRQALYAWVASFAVLALAGLVDFWRWNYDYGHNLDYENAIIKVPGTVYQPPLFGVRQILNFRAASFPDVGGWMAFGAFALAAVALLLALRAGGAPARLRVVEGAA